MQTLPGTIRYFNDAATGWSDRYQDNQHFRKRLDLALHLIDNEARKRYSHIKDDPLHVLDYGCATGVLIRALLERGFTVTGVDVSSRMLELAQDKLTQYPDFKGRFFLEQVTFDGSAKAYQKQKYPIVTCLGVLEYLDDPESALAHLCGLLAHDGLLVVSVPNKNSILRMIEDFVYQNPKHFKRWALFDHLTGEDCYLKYQKHQFSASELALSLRSHGLYSASEQYHVAPGPLVLVENKPAVGMTLIASFRKQGH